MEVVCDADTGHVFAARALDVQAIGEDAPDRVRLEAAEKQVCEVIEVTAEQALVGLPELFATHKLRKGRLVPKKAPSRQRKKTVR
jgi:hypothetical protein